MRVRPSELLAARVLRTAHHAATPWTCAAVWAADAFTRLVRPLPHAPSLTLYWAYFIADGCVADAYAPLLGVLVVAGLVALVLPEVRRRPTILAAALLGVATLAVCVSNKVRE